MPNRFTPVQSPTAPPTGSFTPALSGATSGQTSAMPKGPSNISTGLTASKLGARFTQIGAGLAGNRSLGTGAQALGGAASLGQGIYGLSRGQTVPGALGITSGVGQLSSAAGAAYPVADAAMGGALSMGGSALGAAASLAGMGYGLSQGNQAGDRMAVDAAMSMLPYVNPMFAAVTLPAKIVELLTNFGLGEGMFGQTKLPFGRGNQFSSADNLASQISQFRGMQGANALQGGIKGATDPNQLLGMALAGPNLSPHGELQFYLPGPGGTTLSGGKGGVQSTPTNPLYAQLVQQAAQGDPQALRQFIGNIQIQSGESGAAIDNYLLTDWYRRQLAGLSPGLDTAGLFQPTPQAYQPQQRANDYLQAISQLNQQYAPAGGPSYSREDAIRGLMGGNVGHQTLNLAFRPPGELIDRATAERMVAGNAAFNQPPEEIPGTWQYAAKYLPQL